MKGKRSSENFGIKYGYPRLRKYFGKLMAYVQLCRPFTGLPPLIAGVIGVLAPVKQITLEHITTGIFVGITLMLAQFCGQCLNQYVDAKMDEFSKSYRPIPAGLVTREEALGVSWLLGLFAVGRAFTINSSFGLTVLVLIFFASFYSLAPFSPRRINAFINLGWVATARGLIPVFAVWSIYGRLEDALYYCILAFIWMFGFQGTKDIIDAEVDRTFGIKTVVNTYGLRGLEAVMLSSLLAYAILTSLWHKPLMFLLLPFGAACILTNKKKVKFMENVLSWVLMYLALGLFYILMFIQGRF